MMRKMGVNTRPSSSDPSDSESRGGASAGGGSGGHPPTEWMEPTDIGVPLEQRDVMLIEFLREYDARCPLCGYELHRLTRPVCPECKQKLQLTVGLQQLRLVWLIIAIAPGIFSGLCAIFVSIPVIGGTVAGGNVPGFLYAADVFGFMSGAMAVGLSIKRNRFIAMSIRHQRHFALGLWAIHVLWFVFVVLLMIAYG